MQNDTDEFDSLRRLLSLKQHEVPPPRFFDQLPGRIMSEIRTQRPGFWQGLLDRLFAIPGFQPVAAAGVAILVGGLFICAFGNGDGGAGSATSAFMGQQAQSATAQGGVRPTPADEALQPVQASETPNVHRVRTAP